MKKAKLSVGTASTTKKHEVESKALLRKSVRAPGNNGGIENTMLKKRKSCPAVGGGMSLSQTQASQLITPERVANIFEPPEKMSAAERTRETRRMVAYIIGIGKSSEADISMTVFNKILGVLQTHVDKIDEDNWNLVVQSLLYALSPKNCGSYFNALEKLVNELLIHRPNYANPILQVLITKLVRSNLGNSNASDSPTLMELKGFDVATKLICRVIEIVGVKSLTRPLLNMLTSSYPYVLRPPLTHFYYIRNLLTVNKLTGNSLTYSILSVIIHKLAQLDSLLPREILESEQFKSLTLPKVERNVNVNSYIITGADAEDFVLEILTAYTKVESEIEQTQQVATLDMCLSYVISYLVSVHETINFTALLSIFEAEVLPTFNTNCIQFCFFELINLKEEFLHAFLNFLWKKFSNVNTPAVLRVQAVGYISGVLARSTKVDRRTLKRWISRQSTYANEYLDSKSTSSSSHWSNVNIHAHAPFYAVCQAIFYTFAFRHFELVYGNMPHLKEEDKNESNKPNLHSLPPPASASQFIYSLNLQRLITSDLNPLKACTPNVAKTFVTAAHAYQISYCKTVLERNNRANIRNMIYENMRDVTNDSEERGVNLLNESFFPFDPLPLPYCKMIVDDNFRVYDPNSLALMLVGETTKQGSNGKQNIDGTETEDSCDLDFDDNDVVDSGDILFDCE